MSKRDTKSNANDQGKAAGGPDGQQKDQKRKERSNMAGDQDVENPNAQRAGAPGVMNGPAGKTKPEKGEANDDQDDRNELDDEDVDTADSSRQKRNEKRHSM